MTLLLPTTAATAHVPLDSVHCMDAFALMSRLPTASVQLIAVDPPYNGVKEKDIAPWDNQWRDDDEFIAWIGALCQEWRRVLTPNGSLYVFASPRMAARVEVEIGRWFNVLNRITWSKPKFSTKAEMFDKDTMRAYFPASEAIIFAEQYGADGGYANNDDALRAKIMKPLKDWFREQASMHSVERRALNDALGSANTGGGMATHYFGNGGLFELPTEAMYAKMRAAFPDAFNRDYADLRREYDDLRREYDDLRRPFNSHPFAPYTDVWDFPTVGHYPGKHPAEKPLAMMEHIVNISSRPGDIVLDCFCGSGTTMDAARRTGRHYIGGDFTAHWVNYTRRRIALDYDVRLPLFEEAI